MVDSAEKEYIEELLDQGGNSATSFGDFIRRDESIPAPRVQPSITPPVLNKVPVNVTCLMMTTSPDDLERVITLHQAAKKKRKWTKWTGCVVEGCDLNCSLDTDAMERVELLMAGIDSADTTKVERSSKRSKTTRVSASD